MIILIRAGQIAAPLFVDAFDAQLKTLCRQRRKRAGFSRAFAGVQAHFSRLKNMAPKNVTVFLPLM